MYPDIYILDTETTGLGGYEQGDVIVEIGIARVDLQRKKVYPEFGRLVRQPLTPSQRESWVFQNTDLTPEEVMSSPWSPAQIRLALSPYINKTFTAYNVDFDFGRYLLHPPWHFCPHLAPCIMETAADTYNEGRWFKAQEAYDLLCPDNPANVPDGREQHRALSDAVVEGWILLRMLEDKPELSIPYVEACCR